MCLQLSEYSGKFIKRVHRTKQYEWRQKASQDFVDGVTVADTTVQKTIEYNLKELYPYVKIVGEEDLEDLKEVRPTIMPDQLNRHIISQ